MSASGDEIANEGEERLPMVSNSGVVAEQKWLLAAVTRLARRATLATVWCLVVVAESSRILHSGEVTPFIRENGVYLMDMWIPPLPTSAKPESDFEGLGQR